MQVLVSLVLASKQSKSAIFEVIQISPKINARFSKPSIVLASKQSKSAIFEVIQISP